MRSARRAIRERVQQNCDEAPGCAASPHRSPLAPQISRGTLSDVKRGFRGEVSPSPCCRVRPFATGGGPRCPLQRYIGGVRRLEAADGCRGKGRRRGQGRAGRPSGHQLLQGDDRRGPQSEKLQVHAGKVPRGARGRYHRGAGARATGQEPRVLCGTRGGLRRACGGDHRHSRHGNRLWRLHGRYQRRVGHRDAGL